MAEFIRAEFDGQRLILNNSRLRRVWYWDGQVLVAESVRDQAADIEWVGSVPEVRGSSAPYDDDRLVLGKPWEVVGLETREDDEGGAAAMHLRADLRLRCAAEAAGRTCTVVHRFRVWPDWPVVLQSVVVERGGAVAAGSALIALEREEDMAAEAGPDPWAALTEERWTLPATVGRWESTELRGRSDWRDDLVETRRGVLFEKQTQTHSGHLLHLTQWDRGSGLACLKLAPPPEEHLPAAEGGVRDGSGAGADFKLVGSMLTIRGGGLSRAEVQRCLAAGEAVESYPVGVGLTDGTAGDAAALLRGTLRRLARPRIPAGGVAMSNNWGGGGSVGVLSEAFVLAELDRAAALGLTQVQIDAGWHRGDAKALGVERLEPASTSQADSEFWAVHPERFPRGLEPIRDRARRLGLDLGLWFCLDRADEYARWRDDLVTLLSLHRDLGIVHFKFDGLSFSSRLGEMRVRRLLAELHRQGSGRIAASIDITGSRSRRLGLTSGITHVRDHFVENRYTGNATYRPDRTLRNLWQLAGLVPTYRLEMEWLNVHRHPEMYTVAPGPPAGSVADGASGSAGQSVHPLAPATFGVEYSLAVTLMSLPLAWMHLQALPPEDGEIARQVLEAVRPHQRSMLQGDVQPIGEEPSGTSWTGFLSTALDTCPTPNGYLLVFREVTDRSHARLVLPGLAPGVTLEFEPIAGRGAAAPVTLDDRGRARLHLDRPRSYAIYRWQQA